MSWFTWSTAPIIQQSPKTNDEKQEQSKNEKNENKEEKNVFSDLAKSKLPATEEADLKALEAARRPVIEHLQMMSDAWKSGDIVWFVDEINYSYADSRGYMLVARQVKIHDVQRYKKNEINQMAMLLNHELHIFKDLKHGWNEDGSYKGAGGLFPVMLHDQQIIRALISPYIVLFDM